MDSMCGEPVCLWLPEKLRAGKSEYVQGVEVTPDYKGIIPGEAGTRTNLPGRPSICEAR